MKVKLIIISIILLLVMVFACGCIPVMEKLGLVNPTDEEQLSPEKGGPPDGLVKVLIGFKEKPGAAEQALVKGLGGKIKYTYNLIPAIAASVPEVAIEALKKNPNITNVEPDSIVYALDAELDNSWGVKRIGAGIVHDSGKNGEGIKIAIIDTGIDRDHPDLDDNIMGGVNFVSIPSWKTPDPNKWDDDNGHGTHVAGIIAAEDNNTGVVGVAPGANLYALKVLDRTGSGYVSDVVMAIQWATENDIQVINMSLGGAYDIFLDAACLLAYYFDRLILVAAAGNGGSVIYPAAYDSVIAVSATDSDDNLASFSSTGNEVELAAPGVYIYSTYKGGGYATISGTSMASPHVAGTAALVWADNTGWENDDVRIRLQNTAEDIGLLSTEQGYGLVDADEAVKVSLDTGNIEGKVTDEADAVIESATVVVEGTNLSATTVEGGYYLLENVPVETYDVIASADGYYSETATVTIVKDETVTQDFTLQAIPTYLVSGMVTDAENYVLVLEGVTVTIEETGQSATTGNDGAYAISDVKGGTYNITAVKEGYSSQTKTVIVEADITVNFALEEITEELQKLHVNSIDMWYKSAGPNRFVSTKVEIISSDGTAVSAATVYLETTLPDGSKVSGSGDTTGDGTITFETRSRQTGTYTSTVTNVEKDGWEYNSIENVETSDSIKVQ
jgi:subtilisin family serine protease